MGEQKDDGKPATAYAVRDVGPEVLGRVPLHKIPTPPDGSRRGAVEHPATPDLGEGALPDADKPKRRARRALHTDHVRASVVVPRTVEAPERRTAPTFSERAVNALAALRGCGPGEDLPSVRTLLALGPDVLDFVEADFPGLLWFHRHLAHRKLPLGRDIGPLGALLVAFGADAVPCVIRLLESNSADVRYYATLVGSDLLESLNGDARVSLADALGERLFDADSGVRDTACHALLSTGEGEVVAHVASRLRSYASDAETPRATRIVAVRALGALRCVEAVPDLIPLLDDREPTIREMTQRALRLVCAVDLGTSLWRWRRWWKKHAGEPRASWLLAGLESKDSAVRAIAQRELGRVTGYEEPFDAEAPRAERRRVVDRYHALIAEAVGSVSRPG